MNEKKDPMQGVIRETKILVIRAFEFIEKSRTAGVDRGDFEKFAGRALDSLEKGIQSVRANEKQKEFCDADRIR